MERERKLLQRAVAVAGCVPVAAGLFGALFGARLTGDTISLTGDSHYRYLSGLLLGLGLIAWSTIPGIETKTGRLQFVTLVVAVGGLSRLAGLALVGLPSLSMIAALVMELGVTPALCLWQARVARAYRTRLSEEPTRPSPVREGLQLTPSDPR